VVVRPVEPHTPAAAVVVQVHHQEQVQMVVLENQVQ
jgi:hypothetical protein